MNKPNWLKSVYEIVFGQGKVVADIDAPPALRLAQTPEIQAAFRKAFQDIWVEVGRDPSEATFLDGVLDGSAILKSFESLKPSTLPILGFKPEHIRVMKTLSFLLGQSLRVEGTKQTISIFLPLFAPAHPITAELADAYDEVIAVFVRNIG
jgi:hypothetical protein